MTQGNAPRSTQSEFESYLWKAAGSLRGYVAADELKDYILPLLFFRWVSDNWDREHAAVIAEYGADVSPEAESAYHRFVIPEGCHWTDVRMSVDPGAILQRALNQLSAANPDKLAGIFSPVSWGNRERLPNSVISELIHSLDQLTLNSSIESSETLGAVYEHMIRLFADTSGRRGAGIVAPQGVVRLMTRILAPQPGETVYDPACGTGGMLLGAASKLYNTGSGNRPLHLYGQEINYSVAAIARMNLIINGMEDFKIAQGDTLRDPGFLNDATLQEFDIVIADPPFSVKSWGSEEWGHDPYGRAFCGVPPASNADLAWVEHAITSMNQESGRAAILMPRGVLFRGGAEKSIRRCLVEQGKLEAVIDLPPNLFYSTAVPTCLLVANSKKSAERSGAILFIDASKSFMKGRTQNYIDDRHVDVITSAYSVGASEEIPTRLVELAEIGAGDWNMEVSRYLRTAPSEPEPVASTDATAEATAPRMATQELGSICEALPGRNRAATDDNEDPEFRIIRAEDIQSVLAPWPDLPKSNSRKATSVEVVPGDIIGSISGPYGRWVIVPEGYGQALASDHTVVLKKRGDTSMWYLLGFLRSSPGRELIKGTQRGSVISRISWTELKRIPVPYCPLPSDYVDPVLKEFEEEHKRIERGIEDLYSRFGMIYESDFPVEVAARLEALQGITASIRGMTDLGGITRIARSSYPYPIARNLHAIGNTSSQREKYHEVVHEATETLSVTLTGICASVARETATRDGKQSRKWANATNRNGATIGNRNYMIWEVAERLIAEGGPGDIGGIGRALGAPTAPAVVLMKKLLRERNRIHGDYPRTDIQFEQRLMESESDFQRLLEALGFLARWELRYAESVEPLAGEDNSTYFSAVFRILRGDNPDWELVPYASPSPLYRGRLYAFVDEQILIDLHPYLLVRPCEVCGAMEVYHPASFDDSEVNLKSIDRGHSQQTTDERLLAAVQAAFA